MTDVDEGATSLEGLSGRQFKPFACPDCDKHFTRLTYVQRHQKLAHLGKRDHVCSKCGAGFARSDVLSRHMQTCGNGKGRKRKQQPPTEPQASTSASMPVMFQQDSIPVNYNVNAFTVPSMDQQPIRASFSNGSNGSSTENSPLFERTGSGSGSTPGSDLAHSPDSAPLFSTDYSKTLTETGFSTGADALMTTGVSADPQQYDPYAGMPEGFDPFQPLPSITPGVFNFSSTFGGASPSFSDLMFAVDVHQPSPTTFRNPDPTYPLEALSKPFNLEMNDSRFKLGPERIAMITAIGLQKKFKFPTAVGFEKLASLAGSYFQTFSPVIHMPTFNLNTDDLSIGVALATAGASKGNPLDVEGAKEMSEHVLKEKRDYYIQDFAKRTVEIDSAGGGFIGCGETWTGVIRSFLIYQTIGFSHADKAQRRLSASYHGALINMCRLVGFVNKTRETLAYIESLLPSGRPLDTLNPQQLEAHWRKVAQAEQFSRTAWMIWLIDLALAGCHKTPASLTLAEYGSLRLPSNEAAWTAATPAEWALMDAVYPGPPPTLSSALRSAMGSENGASLDNNLGAFAGAVLRRTISYLMIRLSRTPPNDVGTECDPAIYMLWGELGLRSPPDTRESAMTRLQMAMDAVDRACPQPDIPGYEPATCTLSSLDEGLN